MKRIINFFKKLFSKKTSYQNHRPIGGEKL